MWNSKDYMKLHPSPMSYMLFYLNEKYGSLRFEQLKYIIPQMALDKAQMLPQFH
jgi:hypothetical protein